MTWGSRQKSARPIILLILRLPKADADATAWGFLCSTTGSQFGVGAGDQLGGHVGTHDSAALVAFLPAWNTAWSGSSGYNPMRGGVEQHSAVKRDCADFVRLGVLFDIAG